MRRGARPAGGSSSHVNETRRPAPRPAFCRALWHRRQADLQEREPLSGRSADRDGADLHHGDGPDGPVPSPAPSFAFTGSIASRIASPPSRPAAIRQVPVPQPHSGPPTGTRSTTIANTSKEGSHGSSGRRAANHCRPCALDQTKGRGVPWLSLTSRPSCFRNARRTSSVSPTIEGHPRPFAARVARGAGATSSVGTRHRAGICAA